MSIRVVHAHPVPESYSGAILASVLVGLAERGEPILHRIGDATEPGPTADELAATDELWFVHPTWWGGQPAVLLDWIQRTLGPWIDEGAPTTSPLANITRLTAVTTHGSSALINRLQGEPGRQLYRRVLTPLCATGATFEWLALYKIDFCDDADRQVFLDHVQARASAGARVASV
ncbi:MAG: NAD(P)H-dependent oxidoreductase [Actinomycetota bacterium]